MATATPATDVEPLSPRQGEILAYYLGHVLTHGCQPSVRQVMEWRGWRTPNAVNLHLKALERKGYIRRGGCARSLTFLRWPDGLPFRGLRRI